MRGALGLVLMASTAAAEDLPFSPDATVACLAEASNRGTRESCIGKAAEVCYSREGVFSNFAISVCFGAEADYWDARLNTAYAALIGAEIALAEELQKDGVFAPDAVTALRDMQRAWMPFRDAACWYEVATWGGGSGSGPASAECLMHMTGRQALALEARVEERAE